MSASQRQQQAPLAPARAPAHASSASTRPSATVVARPAPSAPRQPVRTSSTEEGEEDAATRKAREARKLARWREAASAANKDLVYPVVFDSHLVAPETRAAVIQLLGGREPRYSNLQRRANDLEAASNRTDVGTAQVGIVTAQQYEAIEAHFTMCYIMVTMDGHPRMAWVPGRPKPQRASSTD